MAQTTPKNSGYTIINGSTTGKNGAKVNTWLEYKVTQSIANNTSTIDVYLYARANTSGLSTSWDGTRSYGSITFDGTSHAGASISGYDFRSTSIYNEFAHYSQTVTHDSTGKKTITLAGAWDKGASSSTYITGGSVPSTSVTLPTIPRYATISQSLGGKTETGITVKWSSDSTIDYVWYSKDNGSNWTAVGSVNATSGSYTISGLSANTSYTIKTRVRRKDSQLTTDSSAMTQTTYNYPYATSMPNFTIGNTLTIGLYNPLGRTVTVSIIGADNSECSRDNTSGTSITGYTYSSIVNALYNSIPNAKSGTYKVKVTYGSSVITKTGGTYSANASACTPNIGSLTYQDTKTATVNITGNNQQIIRNQSTVRYTASSLSAKNGATISSVKVVVNGSTYNLTVSGTSATGGNAVINSGTNVTATATITDSRGYTATKTVTVQMLDWVLPTATLTLQRQNNFYSNTTIKADAYYSSLGGKNSITITYKAKPTSASSWTYTGSLSDNVGITLDMDNEQDWNVQIVVTDKLGSTTYNAIVNRGTPIIYFDRVKSSVGIEGFPNDNRQLKVEGIIEGEIRKFKDRQTSANLTEDGLGGMSYFLATSSMAEGKPPLNDGHIIHMGWDNTNGFDSQLAVVHTAQPQLYARSQANGVWGDWMAVGDAFWGNLTSGDFDDLTTRGTYFINTNSGMTNAPFNDYGYLIVRHFNAGTTLERTMQEFYTLYGQRKYVRFYANGQWRPWRFQIGDAMPFFTYTSSATWNFANPSLTEIANIYAYAGENAIVQCTYTGGGSAKFLAIVDYGNINYGGLALLQQSNTNTLISYALQGGTWRRSSLNPFGAGESYSATFFPSGYVTSSTTSVNMMIPMPRSMANISTITVTSLVGGMRGISGYVNGSSDSYEWVGASGITVSAYKSSDTAIRLYITKSSALTNVTNNTPVSMQAVIKMTFN